MIQRSAKQKKLQNPKAFEIEFEDDNDVRKAIVALFNKVSNQRGFTEAKALFEEVLRRPRGRPRAIAGRVKNRDGALLALRELASGMTQQEFAEWAYNWFRDRDHETGRLGRYQFTSKDAIVKRLNRLRKSKVSQK